jgi:hypothetical protein
MICGQYKAFSFCSFDGVFDFVSFLLKSCFSSVPSLSADLQNSLTSDAGLWSHGACGIAEEATPDFSRSAGVIPTLITRNVLLNNNLTSSRK